MSFGLLSHQSQLIYRSRPSCVIRRALTHILKNLYTNLLKISCICWKRGQDLNLITPNPREHIICTFGSEKCKIDVFL